MSLLSLLPPLLLLSVISYLLGAIPFGVIFAKAKGIDLQKTGSGNIGTSNAFRALGPVWGGLVFVFDTLKGFSLVFLVGFLDKPHDMCIEQYIYVLQIFLGILAICGHNYSIFLKFKGGKGVATSFGVFLALTPVVSLLALLIWIVMVLSTKISSLASIIAAISLPVLMISFSKPIPYILFSILASALVIYTHRENIKRLINKSELKMSTKEKKNITS